MPRRRRRPSATPTCATTTSRPSTTTRSGASTSARSARRRCRQAAQGARRQRRRPFGRALEIGAGTGYFTLNLLQAGLVRAGGRDRHLARDAATRCGFARERLGLDVETARLRRRGAAVRRRPLRPRLRPRGAAPPAGPRRRVPRVPARAAPGGAVAFCGEPSRYGDRLAGVPKRGALALAPVWRRAGGRAAQRRRLRRHGRGGPSSSASWTSTRSRPASCAPRRARRVRRRARARRGAGGALVRLGQPHARVDGRARRRALGVAPVRLPRLPGLPAARPPAARAAPARRRSSTTCWCRRAA